MTPNAPTARYKPANSLEALRLLGWDAVRVSAALVLLLVVAGDAGAQGNMMSTMGTCSGGLQGVVGLSIPGSSGTRESVATTYVGNLFGHGECVCATTDINLRIQIQQALPAGNGQLELWVGQGCDQYAVRTNATQRQCERIDTPSLSYRNFTQGGSTNVFVDIPIDAGKLFDPQRRSNNEPPFCETPTVNNTIYLLLISGDPQNPAATCTLSTTQVNQGPDAPGDVTGASGDGAVTVTWGAPPFGGVAPFSYQVLCADENGNPAVSDSFDQAYTVCVDGQISRRKIPTGSSLGGTGTFDGGTSARDLGTTSAPLGTSDTELAPQQASTDGGAPTAAEAALNTLDPRYLCAPELIANATTGRLERRVQGLENFRTYYFRVVSIDIYGNPTPSAIVAAEPRPVEDLYRRFRNAGGSGNGFCFVATAAYGSYDHPIVRVLRDFRDEVLLATAGGRSFVDWYYQHSPGAAAYIAERPALRVSVRVLLWPVALVAAALVYPPAWLWVLAFFGLAAHLVGRRPARRDRAGAA
jgi:hypothetical protein